MENQGENNGDPVQGGFESGSEDENGRGNGASAANYSAAGNHDGSRSSVASSADGSAGGAGGVNSMGGIGGIGGHGNGSINADSPAYRSGVAARLAGLSVETLRVWERRYGVSDTERSPQGQRLYSAAQVHRLRLLKSLVDQGHPIGLIAGLTMVQLQELGGAALSQSHPAGPIRVGLVGQSLAERMAAAGRDSLSLDVRCSSARLEQAMSVLPGCEVELLVVEISELDESAVPLIGQAMQAADAVATLVLYRFCASAIIRRLRDMGCVVARVPADPGELVLLCRTALAGRRAEPLDQGAAPPAPPRFDVDTLTGFVTAGNKIGCDCPKHLAEILMMVGSFERYSAQCASRNPEDGQLHKDLELASGQARVILEAAMEQLAQADGLKY